MALCSSARIGYFLGGEANAFVVQHLQDFLPPTLISIIPPCNLVKHISCYCTIVLSQGGERVNYRLELF